MNVEGNAKFKAMEERHLAIEARLTTIENPGRSPARSSDPKEPQQTQKIQRTTRAVAAGFIDVRDNSSDQQTARNVRQKVEKSDSQQPWMQKRGTCKRDWASSSSA